MLRKNLGLFIFLGVLVILIGYGCNGYNGLVNQDENVNQAWNNVQSDYQRRADLIPNLVNTVKGEANFEQTTLQNVIAARASATQMKVDAKDLTPEKLQQFQANQGQLSQLNLKIHTQTHWQIVLYLCYVLFLLSIFHHGLELLTNELLQEHNHLICLLNLTITYNTYSYREALKQSPSLCFYQKK